MQRHGAKATKKLGAGGETYLAGLLHLFVNTMSETCYTKTTGLVINLFVVVV